MEIINNTAEAFDEYGHAYGSETQYITLKDMEALKTGKALATGINSEYVLFILLKDTP